MGYVTIAVFAKRIGTDSRSTIYRAIETGKLSRSVIKVKGKWKVKDIDEALAEWAESYPPDDARTNPSLRAKIKKAKPSEEADAPPQADAADEKSKPVPKKIVSDAKLAAYRAEMAELELLERQGILVRRENIDKALFAAGQEFREAFLSMPDRIADNLIAVADNRVEFHSMLMAEICAVLEKLSDPVRTVEANLKT